MTRLLLSLLTLALGLGGGWDAVARSTREEVPRQLVAEFATYINAEPTGVGPPCADRAAWQQPEVQQRLRAMLPAADKLLTQPFPAWSDDAYREYSLTGVRAGGERMMIARKAWLHPLVLAECATWQGKYLAAIANTLQELNRQPSWTWPAHDRNLRNFLLRKHDVDLGVADTAHDLAQALYMLGEQLPPTLHTQIRATLETRVFQPMRQSYLQGGSDNWWRSANHNWNAVCLKGVTGAALTLLNNREDRALFAAAGQYYIRHYLGGFPADGYSPEGPGYWNYGVSHFALLRHILADASNGRIELFDHPVVRPLALYGYLIETSPDNIAAFGDASRHTRIDGMTRAYLNQALGLGAPHQLAHVPITPTAPGNASPLVEAAFKLFVATPPPPGTLATYTPPLHSYFEQSRVLVSRPGAQQKLGIAFKAGGNGNHSHNDIGSYTIMLGAEQPTGDPGSTVYSAKTFSKQRYDIKAINSYGHPVPVVAGQLQANATQVEARVLSYRFAVDTSEIHVDMAPAYPGAPLRRLTRRVLHDRQGQGSVLIEDEFEFWGGAYQFEVALITRGDYTLNTDGSLYFAEKAELLHAHISASADYELRPETISEEGLTFQRIAIRLKTLTTRGWVRVRFF